jgi:uncharacterized coiled-coil DUF342 family protein
VYVKVLPNVRTLNEYRNAWKEKGGGVFEGKDGEWSKQTKKTSRRKEKVNGDDEELNVKWSEVNARTEEVNEKCLEVDARIEELREKYSEVSARCKEVNEK